MASKIATDLAPAVADGLRATCTLHSTLRHNALTRQRCERDSEVARQRAAFAGPRKLGMHTGTSFGPATAARRSGASRGEFDPQPAPPDRDAQSPSHAPVHMQLMEEPIGLKPSKKVPKVGVKFNVGDSAARQDWLRLAAGEVGAATGWEWAGILLQ